MPERNLLLESIAHTIVDYREGDIVAPTPEHVRHWVDQFGKNVQVPILREMDHVLKKTYISRNKATRFLRKVFQTEELVGDDPCAFCKSAKFLDIQGRGASQREMLALFNELLQKQCGFGINECEDNTETFIYFDDAIFSGGHVKQDLISWIVSDAPDNATVHVVVFAVHEGFYYNKNEIKKAINSSGKGIVIKWWKLFMLENRKRYINSSDVLCPTILPEDADIKDYLDSLGRPVILRDSGKIGKLEIFSSDEGRQILEQEFLKVGIRIRKQCPKLNKLQRPLGNMTLDTLGFGSLIVTFRNCPNNAPLALWVGKPWYPLFPRVINSATARK